MNPKFYNSPEEAVQMWVQNTIIPYNFCPFAATEVKRNSIRYTSVCIEKGADKTGPASKSQRLETALECVLAECRWLDEHPETETTLLILPEGFDDFYDFLDLADLAEALLAEPFPGEDERTGSKSTEGAQNKKSYEGIYQIATFHPDYYFEGCAFDDPANYTNRAPYPVLHLLRENSLERAIARHPDPEGIPERNTELARRKGAAAFQQILADISAGKK